MNINDEDKMKVGDKVKIEVYPEMCCDDCGDVIHNHLDCPACGKKYAPSDQYGEIGYGDPATIGCEECGARFSLVSGFVSDGEWEMIKEMTGEDD